MKRFLALSGVLALAWSATVALLLAERPAGAARDAITFTLPDVHGRPMALDAYKDHPAIAIVFLGTECPLVQMYLPRLVELQNEFAPKGVQFLAINSCLQDSTEAIKLHAEKAALNFPVLIDADQKVADLLDARRTPTAIVLNAQREVVYRGRIDDQLGVGFQRPYVTRRDLAEALLELLAGRPITKPTTPAPGCIISRDRKEAASDITYCKQVSRIIQRHCLECHRPGQIGPFPMTSYDKVKAWAETMRETVLDGRMPPWTADPRYGQFVNDRRLPEKDKQQLLAWIDAGCPKGDDKDLPPEREFDGNDGWAIGKPDIVLTMSEAQVIPAKAPKGGYGYQYVMIPTNFREDVWVQAVMARPGNKAVTHHILVFIQPPGRRVGSLARGLDSIGATMLVGTAPGDAPGIYPEGCGKKIPAGSYLLLQMHYTPIGTEQRDQSAVGIITCKTPPKHEVRTRAIMNRRLALPPGDDNFRVTASSVFEEGAELLALLPHMHVRGKDYLMKVHYPGGREEIILSMPRYDFSWQTYLRFAKPVRLPPGTRMECIAHYDNSRDNPSNPDWTKTVFWGEQTWEEMMIGWVDYYVPTRTIEAASARKP